MDRAYVDFGRLWRFSEELTVYVTRAKKRFQFKRIESFPKDKSKGVMADQIIELTVVFVKLRTFNFLQFSVGG